MKTVKLLDIIKSFGGYLRIDNKAGYKDEYELDTLGNKDFITKKIFQDNVSTLISQPVVKNIPQGSETPIIINFANSTIKIGTDSPVSIGYFLTPYVKNPTILFEIITSINNTIPKEPSAWVANKEWSDNNYTSLVELTLQPDTDTGLEGGLTLDDINIIIKY